MVNASNGYKLSQSLSTDQKKFSHMLGSGSVKFCFLGHYLLFNIHSLFKSDTGKFYFET